MTHDEHHHCYFCRQPTTARELQQAINAVCVLCCGAVQYRGSDPEVLKKLQSLGYEPLNDA